MATPREPASARGSTSSTKERERYLARERKRRQRGRERAATGRNPQRNDHISAIIGKAKEAVIHEVLAEELRPVVREAIDDEVRQAIKMMVGLAPAALLSLARDLESDDEVIRHKAASLITKYTLGNPLVTPPREDAGEKLVIINAMPRPAAVAFDGTPLPESLDLPNKATRMIEATADDECMRRCDTCGLVKPCSEFPGDGPRCQTDMDEKKQQVIEAFLKPDEREQLLSSYAVRKPSSAEDVQRPREPRRPEIRQAGEGLQSGDLRPSWVQQDRPSDPSGHEGGSDQARQEALREPAEAFGGPPDPKRFSYGSD